MQEFVLSFNHENTFPHTYLNFIHRIIYLLEFLPISDVQARKSRENENFSKTIDPLVNGSSDLTSE